MNLKNICAAWIVAGFGACLVAAPAWAQFGSLRETAEVTQGPGAAAKASFNSNTLFISPYTVFQRTGASVGSGANGGHILAFKENDAGPLIVYEKLYRLDVGRSTYHGGEGQTLSLGAWYWYSGSSVDRYAVYGKYFFNSSVGAQLSVGGDSHTGVYEYYAFALYNALRPTKGNNLAIQLGLGPYIPRTELGSPGYTYTVEAAYNLSAQYSIMASLWFLNYKNKFPPYGFSETTTTARYTVGVGYSF